MASITRRASSRVCSPSNAQLPDDSLIVVWSEYKNDDGDRWGNIHAAQVAIH